MLKRILSSLLCLCLLCSLPLFAFAEGESAELSIRSAGDFLAFAESCRLDSYSQGLSVSLECDIDLSGSGFQGVPIFSGSFDGKGHTVSGISITVDGSALGLFRYLTEGAELKDLTVSGSLLPGGSRSSVGGLVGENEGTIRRCSFEGSVSGSSHIGGIAGKNGLSGIIDGCSVSGKISGKHFTGGIAGENKGVIRNSENSAVINAEAQENQVDIDDISLESIMGSEAANTVTDVGGIAGQSSGLIRACENYGDIGYRHMGYNVGGIAGTHMGYITDCENYGSIAGRKEVGGIIGQAEPVTMMEFTADALQLLQGQLDTLKGLTENATANAQGAASQMGSELGVLGGHVSDAMQAVGTLIPSGNQGGEVMPDIPGMPEIPGMGDAYLPDQDTIDAARANLSASMSGMQSSMNSMMSGVQGAVNNLSNDMRAITNQISAMSGTIGNAAETMGGSISDVSDLDTADMLSGKAANCVNHGSVLADLNVGGIVGAIAIGNDLDHEDDLNISGENSLNFESRLRSVVLSCENRGTVTATKQSGGGIVGTMHFGLLKDCANTGAVDNPSSDYMGGIAGQSRGFIRACYAKCVVSGDNYVGGIAGHATVITDCRAMTLLSGRESYGGILGSFLDDSDEAEPLSRNYYTALDTDPGAVDAISYEGQAKPLPLADFLALENLPQMFGSIELDFVYDDGRVETVRLRPGEPLTEAAIPPVPEKHGYLGKWAGLESLGAPFDSSIYLEYTPLASTVESQQLRPDGRPVLLLSGELELGARIIAGNSQCTQELVGNRTLIDTLPFSIEGSSAERVTLRYLPPEGTSLKHLVLTVTSSDGSQEQVDYRIDGSYLVFIADSNAMELTVEQDTGTLLLYGCFALGGLCLLLLIVMLIAGGKRRRRRRHG